MPLSLSLTCWLVLAGAEAPLHQVTPAPYDRALRNPLMGLTTLGGKLDHPWATLAHVYIPWNAIEASEADGVEQIRAWCDQRWRGCAERGVKIIPRVYLHWSDDKKYWPADLPADDYTSPVFQRRVVRLIEKLGQAWDTDPRVAFIELGIFGKWGEHHSPSPTPEMQQLVGEAFRRAFPHKLVSVRHAWQEFVGHGFGEYWDSWAHYQQVGAHGLAIRDLNERTGLWRTNYIGGETAYDWGLSKIQPGDNATDSLSDPEHTNFVIHTVRWLHGTQLRWIAEYDRTNEAARRGAEALQKALGYRFELPAVRFTPTVGGGRLRVEFDVRNTGSAPFYYRWPVAAALLAPTTRQPVWRGTFTAADPRAWLPGDGWTEPEWLAIEHWPRKAPRLDWSTRPSGWATPPEIYTVTGDFEVDLPPGRYVLALALLDPAGNLPAVRFATANYWRGGWHPVGVVGVGQPGGALPPDVTFDDPGEDILPYAAGR